MQDHTKILFQLSNELIEMKVDHAVSKSITQVVDQIVNLRQEMQRDFAQVNRDMSDLRQEVQREMSDLRNEIQRVDSNLRQEMQQEIGSLKHDVGQRLSAVETALGMRQQHRKEIRSRFYDYVFQASWLVLGSLLTYAAIHFHVIFQ